MTLAQEPLALTETHEFAGLGFTIDYPAGWFAASDDSVTNISQLEVDHLRAFSGGTFPTTGIGVSLDHRDITFMRGIGLPADATTADLVQIFAAFFEWQEPFEAVEIEVFGVLAASVRAIDGSGNTALTLQGFIADEVFVLFIFSPSDEVLDAFLPTWEAMLASIKPLPGE